MAGHFGFLLHPLEVSDVYRKIPAAKRVPPHWLEAIMPYAPVIYTSHITGIRSPYNEAEGHFVSVPLTPRLMMSLPEEKVLPKLVQAAKVAEKKGARIIGLGAYNAIVAGAGVKLAQALDIGVTTGNSYTAATAVEGALLGAQEMGIDPESAQVTVVGATGSVGRVAAILLARQVKNLLLVGRDGARLQALAEEVRYLTGLTPKISTDLHASLIVSDIIITVSNAVGAIIHPEDLKTGAVVCDIARPRDVSRQVAEVRKDVLVIEGGVVDVPGEVDFHFNFGLPPRQALACMAETMILALEERYDDFTLGKDYSLEQVEEITRLAKKHGFKVGGLRSFDRALTPDELESIREHARRRRAQEAAGA
ncbi:MAG: shikimate dehydrogenase [Clostridiales bacterium]|nr:shikimate dehydrogenase [Clostridiales bacterium]